MGAFKDSLSDHHLDIKLDLRYKASCFKRANGKTGKIGICGPSENINERSVMPQQLKIPNYSYKGGMDKAIWGHKAI